MSEQLISVHIFIRTRKLLLCIGSDKPLLKDLYVHVVNRVAPKWKDLGIQLLRPDQEKMIDTIEANCPHDVLNCCKRLLKKWLDTTIDATWNELMRALRRPSVQLDYLADQLEQMLIPECKTYSYINATLYR